MACVAEKIQKIRNLNLTTPTTHLISIGGWNAPHPDTSHSASEMYDAWRKWNTETIVDPDRGFYGKTKLPVTSRVGEDGERREEKRVGEKIFGFEASLADCSALSPPVQALTDLTGT